MTPNDVLDRVTQSMIDDIEEAHRQATIRLQKLDNYHTLRKDLSNEICNLIHKRLQIINEVRQELDMEDINKVTLERLKLNNGFTGWYFTLTIDPILDLLPMHTILEVPQDDSEPETESEFEELSPNINEGDESNQS